MTDPTAIVLPRITDARLRAAYLDTRRRGWTPLIQALTDGNEGAALSSIDGGADVDALAEGAICALGLATEAANEPLVARLLAAGADACVRVAGDRTLLHLAARHDRVALVQMLVDAGAQVDSAVDRTTPLHVAIEHGRTGVFEVLLDLPRADMWTTDVFGYACERGDLAAIRLLWARHETKLIESSSSLIRAARGGQCAVIEFLLDVGVSPEDFDLKDELSPLMHAVAAGHHAAARTLLERGAQADTQTEWFVTALGLAEQNGDPAMIELLRAHGATVSEFHGGGPEPAWRIADITREAAVAADDVATLARLRDEGGTASDGTWRPPLSVQRTLDEAAAAGATHALAFALACGADPLDGSAPMHTPLVAAIRASQSHCVRMMLAVAPGPLGRDYTRFAAGQCDPWILADVLAHGTADADALHTAAMGGRWHHAALLLDHGVEPSDDRSPLILAAELGHVRLVELLVDRDRSQARIDAALLAGVRWPRVVDALLARGADVTARNADRDTLLHLAARHADASIERFLALAGQFRETPGRLGWTPLHAAAMSGSVEKIERLLAAGARVDARSADGDTPLHLACRYARRPGIVEALLAAGAAVDATNVRGETPLHAAIRCGPHPVALLLAAGADPAQRDAAGRTACEHGELSLQHWDAEHADRKRAVELLRAHAVAPRARD